MEIIANGWMFYVLLLILVLSFRKKERDPDALIGKECTSELKGFAILLVLIGHMTIFWGMFNMPLPVCIGAQAVEIFLFLSGFGLTASFYEKGLEHFIRKRLSTVYIPFLTVNVIKLPFYLLWFGLPVVWTEVLKNFIGISASYDMTMWYVQFIFICYVLFFIVFSIKKLPAAAKTAIIFVCLTALGILLFVLNNKSLETGKYFALFEGYSHFLGFPLGIGACVFLKSKKRKGLPAYVNAIAAVISFLCFYYLSGYVSVFGLYAAANVFFLVFALNLFLFLRKFGLYSMLLEKLGTISYSVYLNEMIVISVIAQLTGINTTVKILFILAASIVLAVLTKWISDRLVKKVKGRN